MYWPQLWQADLDVELDDEPIIVAVTRGEAPSAPVKEERNLDVAIGD